MRQIFKEHFGFTLVEVLITTALIGGISLALVQITSDSGRSSKYAFQMGEINEITNDISKTLKNREACVETFRDLKDGDDVFIIQGRVAAGPPATFEPKYEVNKTYGQGSSAVTIKSMTLKKQTNESSNIEIELIRARDASDQGIENAQKRNFGNIEIKKRVSVETVYNSTTEKVEDCKTENEENIIGFCTSLEGHPEGTPGSKKCRNIKIHKSPDKAEPAITAEDYVHIKGGLAIGSAYTSDQKYNPDLAAPFTGTTSNPSPNVGNVHMGGSLMLNKNITFFRQDVTLDAQLAKSGNDLHIYEKAGYDIQLGKNEPYLYRDNAVGFGINKTDPELGYDLDIKGALKVGNKIKLDNGVYIETSGKVLKLTIPAGQNVEITGGTNNTYGSETAALHSRVATRKWVLQAIGAILADNPTALNSVITAAVNSAGTQGLVNLRKQTCANSSTLKWAGNLCETKTASVSCPGSNTSIKTVDFSNASGSPACTTITTTSIGAATNTHSNTQHTSTLSLETHGNSEHNPTLEPTHSHPYSSNSHGNSDHSIPYARAAHSH